MDSENVHFNINIKLRVQRPFYIQRLFTQGEESFGKYTDNQPAVISSVMVTRFVLHGTGEEVSSSTNLRRCAALLSHRQGREFGAKTCG